MNTAEARTDLTLPASLRSRLDGVIAELERQAYAAGKRDGERAAMARIMAMTGRPGVPTIAEIQRAVAERFGTDLADMHSHRRGRAVAWPRQVAMYLARHLTPHSLPMIGHHFGGRDHTTVMWAIKVVGERRNRDQEFETIIASLEVSLRSVALSQAQVSNIVLGKQRL